MSPGMHNSPSPTIFKSCLTKQLLSQEQFDKINTTWCWMIQKRHSYNCKVLEVILKMAINVLEHVLEIIKMMSMWPWLTLILLSQLFRITKTFMDLDYDLSWLNFSKTAATSVQQTTWTLSQKCSDFSLLRRFSLDSKLWKNIYWMKHYLTFGRSVGRRSYVILFYLIICIFFRSVAHIHHF